MTSIILTLDLVNILLSFLTLLMTFVFLSAMPILYHRSRLTFFTLLACNTCVSTTLFTIVGLCIATYMYIYSQSVIEVKRDVLCTVRGYLIYIAIAAVYHSYVLQTVFRYWHIKRITRFNAWWCRVFCIIIQWSIDIIIPLPGFFTGTLNELSWEYVCLISVNHTGIFIYISVTVFIIPLGIILLLYRRLVRHILEPGVTIKRCVHVNRDVTVIARIVQTISTLLICGLPYEIFSVISWFNEASVPRYYFQIVHVFVTSSMFAQLVILIVYTAPVKKVLLEVIKKLCKNHNRIQPTHGAGTGH